MPGLVPHVISRHLLSERHPPPVPLVYHRPLRLPEPRRRASAGFVASGGVSVAYRVGFSARAAPRDACCRRHPRWPLVLVPAAFPPKACSISSSAAFRNSSSAKPRAGELLRRSVRPQSAAPPAPPPRVAGSGPAFCVRSCDGKYFPLTCAAMPRRFRPARRFVRQASPRCFTAATSTARPRAMASAMPTAKTPSPIARRCVPTAPATAAIPPGWRRSISRSTPRCAPATSSPPPTGWWPIPASASAPSQTAEFTPVASYPGLTADVRARLGEMKVAPVSAEMVATNAPLPETQRDVELTTGIDAEGGEAGGSELKSIQRDHGRAAAKQALEPIELRRAHPQ